MMQTKSLLGCLVNNIIIRLQKSMQMEIDNLFESAMRGHWDHIVQAYESNPMSQEAKITKSEDTALHLAAASGHSDVVCRLVETMGENESNILKIQNNRGNTALHLAAALGNVEMCRCMASKDPKLVGARNKDSETPLFLAALNGKKAAFLCLHFLSHDKDSSLGRKSNGDTILHAAISGDYFSLAFHIIRCYPDLVNCVNENGLSPLHILAGKPNAFRSSSCLGLFDLMLYDCVSVDELREEKYDYSKNYGSHGTAKFPENYRTCINFFRFIWTSLRILSGLLTKPKDELDEEDPQQNVISREKEDKEDHFCPPNCTTFVLFSKLMMKALLIVLGIGIWRISRIKEKKVRHKWAYLVMKELVQCASLYKYDDNGQNPENSRLDNKHGEPFLVPGARPVPENTETSQKNIVLSTPAKKNTQQSRRKETPLLIATKTGVLEIVEKILDAFPVAIQDEDANGKNVVLLAVEHRQTHIYELLLKKKMIMENAFRKLDNQGNSALHYAAMFENHRPSSLIPGAALQMQWEIKWYKYVKESMPQNFFVRYNNNGQTPKELFTETHKKLVKEGSKWLIKTSEACSVVAALIATVAFAASATVPGGLNEDNGKPILLEEIAFRIFAISSLVSLCFSVTALIVCLAILTSRYQEKDFAMALPRKLLIGLTSLHVSVVSVWISFCAGHYLVIRDMLRSMALPMYAATCLPMAYFALIQLPLYVDLMLAIFKKVPQPSYKVFSL
ncbi:hypothetical protein WN943_029608 [Citrus x changshan-huyou]